MSASESSVLRREIILLDSSDCHATPELIKALGELLYAKYPGVESNKVRVYANLDFLVEALDSYDFDRDAEDGQLAIYKEVNKHCDSQGITSNKQKAEFFSELLKKNIYPLLVTVGEQGLREVRDIRANFPFNGDCPTVWIGGSFNEDSIRGERGEHLPDVMVFPTHCLRAEQREGLEACGVSVLESDKVTRLLGQFDLCSSVHSTLLFLCESSLISLPVAAVSCLVLTKLNIPFEKSIPASISFGIAVASTKHPFWRLCEEKKQTSSELESSLLIKEPTNG